MVTQKVPKLYTCEKCAYNTSRKSQFNRHNATLKHNLELNGNAKSSKIDFSVLKCLCGKQYKFMSGLSRHKMFCNFETINTYNDSVVEKVIDNDFKEMFMTLVKQNVELQKTIQNIVPKIGNTINNSFTQKIDIHMYLNEHCKDAINLCDFIKSLPITVEDLDRTGEMGIIEGVTNTMIKGLEKLQIHERPFHCSDTKRDIMYIKDHNVWDKDENNEKLKKSIETVADKQLFAAPIWEAGHPNFLICDSEKDKYVRFIGNASIDILEDTRKMNKIIKILGKEVYLPKEDLK